MPSESLARRLFSFSFSACRALISSSRDSTFAFRPAGVVFAVASFTDLLDGKIARKYNLVTDFGKFADPLADKLLTTVAFLYMMRDGVCSIWVVGIILAREFAVSGVRMVAAGAPGGKVIAANIWGKLKTVLQMLSIILYYFSAGLASPEAIGAVMPVATSADVLPSAAAVPHETVVPP